MGSRLFSPFVYFVPFVVRLFPVNYGRTRFDEDLGSTPLVSDWVAAVLEGKQQEAAEIMREIGGFPIRLTRDPVQAMN